MENWKPIEIDDKNFDREVLKSAVPVLVDFWAPWCAPCRMIGPVVEEVAQDMKGKIRVAKVNVDDNSAITMNFKISGIPALLLFKDGKVALHHVGATSKVEIVKMIEKALTP